MSDEALRWLIACGFGVPIFHLIVPLILGMLHPGYSPMKQFISELATPKRPYALLVSASFVFAGLLTIPFSIALYNQFPPGVFSWIAPTLLFIHGLSNVGAGIFPVEVSSFAGRIHTVVSQFGLWGSLVAPFFVWLNIRNGDSWHFVAVFSLVMQAAIMMVFAVFVYVTETRRRASSKAVIGLFQRLYLAVYYVWITGLVIRLIL